MKIRLALVTIGLAATTAFADDASEFKAKLSSYRENPPLFTGANGEFKAELSGNGNTIEFELTFRDLKGGPATASHIHIGHPWINGPIAVHLCGTGGRPACPAMGVTLKGTIIAGDVQAVAASGLAAGDLGALLQGIRAGATYVNVHNGTFPAGEIRGQVRGDDNNGRGRGNGSSSGNSGNSGNGGSGQFQAGDDRGNHVEPGDDHGKHVEPGDDRGGANQAGDDKGGGGNHAQPGDDKGGSN